MCFFRIKLISSGSVINRLILLEDQSIQNNQQIMAIVLATTPTETITENAMYDKVKTIKDDAKLLVDKSDSYMDVSSIAKKLETQNQLHILFFIFARRWKIKMAI